MSEPKPPTTPPAPSLDAAAYEKAMDALKVGICIWQLERPEDRSSLRLVACNPAAAAFLGRTREEILGKPINEGFPGALETPLPGVFTQIAQSGQGMSLGEVPYVDQVSEPGVFTIDAHAQPDQRVCVEFTNITERKRAEAKVAEKTEALTRTLNELWSEMDLARKIQTVLLPNEPSLGGYEVAAEMRPAATVGGDYFDVFEAGGVGWLLIGDVSGHGVSAGLIMMMVQTAVRTAIASLTANGDSPAPSRVLSVVNSAIRANLAKIGNDQYMTINALCLSGGKVRHAGLHQDIFVYRHKSGEVQAVETDGIWLGVVDDAAPLLSDASLDLDEGDVLLLYTDGVVEVRDEHGPVGPDRLRELLRREAQAGASAQAIVRAVLEQASALQPTDDITAMVARRRSGGDKAP